LTAIYMNVSFHLLNSTQIYELYSLLNDKNYQYVPKNEYICLANNSVLDNE